MNNIQLAKIPINYYPEVNQGITLKLSGEIDCWRMYCTKVRYETIGIAIFPDFDFKTKTFPNSIYTEYVLLQVNGTIDYSVLTSLN